MNKIRNLSKNEYISERDRIVKLASNFIGKNCIYLLDFGGDVCNYKFGMTTDIVCRLKTHFRNHCIIKDLICVRIWDCVRVADVERFIKNYAHDNNILVRYRGETEVIRPNNNIKIEDVVDVIDTKVKEYTDEKINKQNINVNVNVRNMNIKQENDKKCYNCGKEFRTPAEYQRHKNRKTLV